MNEKNAKRATRFTFGSPSFLYNNVSLAVVYPAWSIAVFSSVYNSS